MKIWAARAISFAIAWTIVLLVLGVCGELLDFEFLASVGATWICAGILARVARSPASVADALPRDLDVGAALKFLLVSVLWPVLLFLKGR